MNEGVLRRFGSWEKSDCDECGCQFQVTRTNPQELMHVICSDCESYMRGFADGLKQKESRDVWTDLSKLIEQYDDQTIKLNDVPRLINMLKDDNSYKQLLLDNPERQNSVPYLKNYADAVDGHYCIARKHSKGYSEFWNESAGKWCSAGTVLKLGKIPE